VLGRGGYICEGASPRGKRILYRIGLDNRGTLCGELVVQVNSVLLEGLEEHMYIQHSLSQKGMAQMETNVVLFPGFLLPRAADALAHGRGNPL